MFFLEFYKFIMYNFFISRMWTRSTIKMNESRQNSKPSIGDDTNMNKPIVIDDDDDDDDGDIGENDKLTSSSTAATVPDDANTSSSYTIVDQVDVDTYETDKQQLWQQIGDLCKRLLLGEGIAGAQCNPDRHITEQHVILKQIDTQYASRIKEEGLWKFMLRQYYRISRTSLYVWQLLLYFNILLLSSFLSGCRRTLLAKTWHSLSNAHHQHVCQICQVSV